MIWNTIAFLNISVKAGRNLLSEELGIPGMFYASVTYDPSYFMSPSRKSKVGEYDATILHEHDLGFTGTANISSNPKWSTIYPSNESHRLKAIIFGANLDFVTNTENIYDNSFVYPILQSVKRRGGEDTDRDKTVVKPWESSDGAIIIQVHNTLNRFFHDSVGEVVLPLAHLAKVENNQVEGWAILQSPDIQFSKHDFQIFSEDEIVEEMDENQNEIKLPSNTSILDTDEYIIDEDNDKSKEK